MNIHHMPGFVEPHRNVIPQTLIQGHVIESVARGEVGGGQIVVAIAYKNLQVSIDRHGLAQGFSHIDILILVLIITPGLHSAGQDFVRQVTLEG